MKDIHVVGDKMVTKWSENGNYKFDASPSTHYGNRGCGIFKGGIQNYLERFFRKNQHTQRKFLNFENWTSGESQ